MLTFSAIDAAAARIGPFVRHTPLIESQALSKHGGCTVHLKLENRQVTGSFKLRGAANKLMSLEADERGRGVVTASNGNHALAVAEVAARLNAPAEIFVSRSICPARGAAIRAMGASLVEVEGDCLAAELAARRRADEIGRTFISPYNDADVIAGQGTIGIELLQALPMVDAVFVAVGGGGLVSGVGNWLKERSPHTEVVGCWPANAPAMYECLRSDRIRNVEEQATLSTSTAGGIEPGSITFEICKRVIDRHVLVSEQEIMDALTLCWRAESELVEGAAGVAVAACLKTAHLYAGKTVAILICGGNVDDALAARIKRT